jgi:hypothetical protein
VVSCSPSSMCQTLYDRPLSACCIVRYRAHMTDALTARRFRTSWLLLGILIGLGEHVLVVLGAALAGRLVKPQGGGFDDLAAVLLVLVGGELLVAVVSLVVGVILIARNRRELGIGVLVGWLVPLLLGTVVSVVIRVLQGG